MNFHYFPYKVDVTNILKEIQDNEWAWNFDRSRESVYEQKDTKTIPIRHGKKRMGKHFYDCHETYDTVLKPYFPATSAFMNYFLSTYGGECGRVALVKLPPDKCIVPHIDYGAYYRARDRFHLVIQGMYQYTVNDELNICQAGDLFWFDGQKNHWTKNVGTIDRLVLIFDIKDCKWRERANVM